MAGSIFSLFFVFSAVCFAANDWSKPCFQGECEYDLPSNSSSASGIMKIAGSPNAITDITTAAGWEILGCAPDALSQDIRLVCKSDDSAAAGCDHLYQNSGAEGKIVRLPENCGKNAFARISRAWVPEDQSIPSSIGARLVRRDGSQPQVKALSLDTNFKAIDRSKAGDVKISVQGINIPGVDASFVGSSPAARRQINSRITGRGFLDDISNAVGNAIDNFRSFNINKTTDLPPIDVDKRFNLLNKTLSCPPITASFNVDVDAKAHAEVTLGVAAEGTIVPPKIEDFAIFAGITADLDGELDLVADLTGTLDSGKIKIFEVGIPGLDFPGILSVGPTFEVNAQAIATLDVKTDLNVGLNFHVDQAQLIFPPKAAQKAGGTFQIGDTPVKLSVSPSVEATGSIEGHIIPSLNLGLSALGDIVDATVFLELDTSAKLTLSLEAGTEASVTINKAKNSTIPSSKRSFVPRGTLSTTAKNQSSRSLAKKTTSAKTTATGTPAVKSSAPVKSVNTVSTKMPSTQAKSKTTSKTTATSNTTSRTSNSTSSDPPEATPGVVATGDTRTFFGGCIDLTAGFDVNAGATADFFGLFGKDTKVTLFSKQFELFKKCFGDGSTAEKRTISRLLGISTRKRANLAVLKCSAPEIRDAAPVVDTTLKAARIKAL